MCILNSRSVAELRRKSAGERELVEALSGLLFRLRIVDGIRSGVSPTSAPTDPNGNAGPFPGPGHKAGSRTDPAGLPDGGSGGKWCKPAGEGNLPPRPGPDRPLPLSPDWFPMMLIVSLC